MFQLVIQYRLCPFFCLNSQRSGDVDSLMAEHLQGKLNSTVLGLAHTTMRQFLNQFRLSSEAVLNHEIKRSVRHLLSHAHRTESRNLIHPRFLRTEEEILLSIIVSHSTQLHMLAVIIIHLLVLNIILSIVLNLVYFLTHNLN